MSQKVPQPLLKRTVKPKPPPAPPKITLDKTLALQAIARGRANSDQVGQHNRFLYEYILMKLDEVIKDLEIKVEP